MAEVRWTLQAADDLEAITNFIITHLTATAVSMPSATASGKKSLRRMEEFVDL
jgi:hypothetical protein